MDVQWERLEIAHKNLTTEQKKKREIITRECKNKSKFSKKKLQQTTERLLVAREEILYLRDVVKLISVLMSRAAPPSTQSLPWLVTITEAMSTISLNALACDSHT